MKKGPWQVIASEVKYKNPWMQVTEDSVVRPDGKKGIYGTFTINPGVGVLALDEQGFVYLTDEFHYAINRNNVEAAVGGVEKGENILSAAKRELKEELGIEAESWTSLGFVEPLTSFTNSPINLFLARKLKFGKPTHEGTETIKTVKVKLEKAVDMVLKGEIFASASCVLILKADKYLRR